MAQFLPLIKERKRKVYQPRIASLNRSNAEYHLLHRFTSGNVEWMANYFLDDSGETRGGALSAVQKMEAALRYLANPGFQTGIAKEMGLHQTTISKTVCATVKKIAEKGHEWIKFPQTYEEVTRAKFEWANTRGFPCTIGAIDCTHVRVEKPSLHGDEYVNRKGYCSINVQATVNGEGTVHFTCCNLINHYTISFQLCLQVSMPRGRARYMILACSETLRYFPYYKD